MKAENVCHVVFIDESKVYIRLCVVICIYFTKKQMQRFCLCVTRFIEHIHVAKRSVPANVSSSPLLQQYVEFNKFFNIPDVSCIHFCKFWDYHLKNRRFISL